MDIVLLKIIKDFLSNLNPDITVQAPSRINLINPLDAVEGDFWMPSVAINGRHNPLSAFLYIKGIDQQSRIKIYAIDIIIDIMNHVKIWINSKLIINFSFNLSL